MIPIFMAGMMTQGRAAINRERVQTPGWIRYRRGARRARNRFGEMGTQPCAPTLPIKIGALRRLPHSRFNASSRDSLLTVLTALQRVLHAVHGGFAGGGREFAMFVGALAHIAKSLGANTNGAFPFPCAERLCLRETFASGGNSALVLRSEEHTSALQ